LMLLLLLSPPLLPSPSYSSLTNSLYPFSTTSVT
jgi:hypothetical protein